MAATSYWRGKRVTVMGLGVLGGGVGAARYLASHGALVTVTDNRDAESLAGSVAALAGLPVTFHLGGHEQDDFTSANADVVVRNPGVPMDSPYLEAAVDSGVPIEMEMSIFFRDCPAPIIGVTGTKGKTTVSALIGCILRAWNPDSLVAGNMGISALMELDRLAPDMPVALELSSFQIESLNDHRLGPHVAVITNIFPDHLDRYRDFEHYAATKRGFTHAMTRDDVVVYNADDPEASRVAGETRAQYFPFGLGQPQGDGAWCAGNDLLLVDGETRIGFERPAVLALAGNHGARNALAAIAAAHAYGVPEWAIDEGLRSFTGVENRLEVVAEISGVTYVNDTSATAPEAAIAGVRVLAPRAQTLRLIAGGADKRTDLTPFADELRTRDVTVYLLEGSATPALRNLLSQRKVVISGTFDSMASAVDSAAGEAQPGDLVALCPACASFGMFRNEFDRGEQFRAAVSRLDAIREDQVQEL
ncbi:MAG: UDP-N-acetylmuramoyl-L-alanine--D-glutamate ligase [Chloroflexia bacterium]|nr:UDP-N-acetylmuramoyl-L-alanine--D-glutamate ligase [Chloroflexia bacterium]